MKKINRYNRFILLYLFVWFGINLIGLERFPFVHTDEAWLSGLSRSMKESGSLAVTEDFFDLHERNPHAIKLLFHAIQIGFFSVFPYSLVTVRIISLLAGVGSLWLFYRLLNQLLLRKGLEGRGSGPRISGDGTPGKLGSVREDGVRPILAAAICVLLSLDVQFVYIARLARQEIFLVLILLAVFRVLFAEFRFSALRGAIAGGLIGVAIGFHPNSFLIAWPGFLWLGAELFRKKRCWKELSAFVATAGLLAFFWVGLSLSYNADFFHDYGVYGEPLGVLDSPDVKMLKLPRFYANLYRQVGGTYYTPNIRFQMVLFGVFLVILPFFRRGLLVWIGFVGFNAGLVIIGKYSQPSIVFLLPFFYLAMGDGLLLLQRFKKLAAVFLTAIFFLGLGVTVSEVIREKESFADFRRLVNEVIPPDSVVLGNLYYDFIVPEGRLYSWRNLENLKENGLSVTDYLKERGVDYVVLGDELDFIYRNRPVWNVLYGNPAFWYPRLKQYAEESCELAGELASLGYGNRIAAYRYSQEWTVRVYRVLP